MKQRTKIRAQDVAFWIWFAGAMIAFVYLFQFIDVR